ncbi:hypothetical protein EXU57_08990 [Segetibacter sp. 3557_3]|uniref:hypothetical protein n=1 Tax=Segetibacter sp. 3557_3 TaxID=2547429 RepID=UPI001058F327|nr:hypothetical protein [Segetibacter sp. 3557_3]TDH26930.1 hypothetical protein EXU57_08990 [Segetibacter sp. 3557_3]
MIERFLSLLQIELTLTNGPNLIIAFWWYAMLQVLIDAISAIVLSFLPRHFLFNINKKVMKGYLFSIVFALLFFSCSAQTRVFVGSTPPHDIVRSFLHISLTDSIDFIRWNLGVDQQKFKLQCHYGLAAPGIPGFSNEQRVTFEGGLTKSGNYYYLKHQGKPLSILGVNANVLHLLDQDNSMLAGNGGYSCALNSTSPVQTDAINVPSSYTVIENPLVYEGRTPCGDLPKILGINTSEACNKMKWYFLSYSDSLTNKPSYFLMGGFGYRKETMARGKWQIVKDKEGRIIYQLDNDSWAHSLNLLNGNNNILFFIDTTGHLLVGNEDFSYTLNRRKSAYSGRHP